jgi:hypothetical protein
MNWKSEEAPLTRFSLRGNGASVGACDAKGAYSAVAKRPSMRNEPSLTASNSNCERRELANPEHTETGGPASASLSGFIGALALRGFKCSVFTKLLLCAARWVL